MRLAAGRPSAVLGCLQSAAAAVAAAVVMSLWMALRRAARFRAVGAVLRRRAPAASACQGRLSATVAGQDTIAGQERVVDCPLHMCSFLTCGIRKI
mmetsp:Transcript_27935/g.82836  ORF Transcript_27935/g.82836 Transcript_27935/m.82836 type:complete len:96 (+) Transcript_27935:923-1210(+)|eukprot:44349-Chlamydomonas_euryale.AAC.3